MDIRKLVVYRNGRVEDFSEVLMAYIFNNEDLVKQAKMFFHHLCCWASRGQNFQVQVSKTEFALKLKVPERAVPVLLNTLIKKGLLTKGETKQLFQPCVPDDFWDYVRNYPDEKDRADAMHRLNIKR